MTNQTYRTGDMVWKDGGTVIPIRHLLEVNLR